MVNTRRQSGNTASKVSTTERVRQFMDHNADHSKIKPRSNLKPAAKTVVQKRRRQISQAPGIGNHILFLFVGPEREMVTIHSDILPEATMNYIEDTNQGRPLYQLPEEDPAIFRIYRLFLYTQRIYSITADDQDRRATGRATAVNDAEWTRLAHCYLFARTVQDEAFANASIDSLIDKINDKDRYPTGIAGEVYDYTSSGDGLRKFLVDIHVWKGHGTWVNPPHDDAQAPREFLQDVIRGLAAAGPRIHEEGVEMPWVSDACAAYHVHAVTAKCEA